MHGKIDYSLQGFGSIPAWMIGHATPYEMAVYAVLSRRANGHGECWPSLKTIADEAGCSLSSVKRALSSLRDAGVISWRNRRGLRDGELTSSVYALHGWIPGQTPDAVIDEDLRREVPPEPTPVPPEPTVGSHRTDRRFSQSEGIRLTELDPDELNTSEDYSSAIADDDESNSSEDRPEINTLCAKLADLIERNGSKRPTVTKAWRTSCRLLIDRDGHSPGDIAKAIDWCQSDEFWRCNILSMPTLRRQYDKLRLAAMRSHHQPLNNSQRNKQRLEEMLVAEGMSLDSIAPVFAMEAGHE